MGANVRILERRIAENPCMKLGLFAPRHVPGATQATTPEASKPAEAGLAAPNQGLGLSRIAKPVVRMVGLGAIAMTVACGGGLDPASAAQAGTARLNAVGAPTITLEDGLLTLQGTDAAEDLTVRVEGDEVFARIRTFDAKNRPTGEVSERFARDQVVMAHVFGAGGNDVIRNGTVGVPGSGVDGAHLSAGGGPGAGGDNNRVTSYADEVFIELGEYSAGGIANSHGDGAVIEGTPAKDVMWSEGDRAHVKAGPGDSVVNLGHDATIDIEGAPREQRFVFVPSIVDGADVVSVGDGLALHAENGARDGGSIVTENPKRLLYDRGIDNGEIHFRSQLAADPTFPVDGTPQEIAKWAASKGYELPLPQERPEKD